MEERYSRQTMLPEIGEEGQRKLRGARVLVVGAGGLGSAVLPYLTGAGAGHIGIADPDVVSLSNLQRQMLYTEGEIGLPKPEMAARRLRSQNSTVEFTLHPEGITSANARAMVGEYDLVMDCTDNYPTRYLIDDACAAEGIPWVHGAIGEFQGRLSVFNHRQHRRYVELYPEREELCSLPRTTRGVLGAVAGVIGALQASEALKILTGAGTPCEGKLLTIDFLTLATHTFEF